MEAGCQLLSQPFLKQQQHSFFLKSPFLPSQFPIWTISFVATCSKPCNVMSMSCIWTSPLMCTIHAHVFHGSSCTLEAEKNVPLNVASGGMEAGATHLTFLSVCCCIIFSTPFRGLGWVLVSICDLPWFKIGNLGNETCLPMCESSPTYHLTSSDPE